MFGRILVPIDGSPASLKAAKIASDFLRKGCAVSVTLLHVALNPQEYALQLEGFYTRPDLPRFREELMEKVQEIAQQTLDQALVSFDSSLKVETVIEYGPPAETICDIAHSGNYGLIIIGNRGLNKLQRLFLGSISSKVTSLAKCPVLVIK